MNEHFWQTYQRDDDRQHDECTRCPALRWKSGNTNWKWRYVQGSETCTPQIAPSPAERAVMVRGRE